MWPPSASNVSNPSPQEVAIDNALLPSVKECAYLGILAIASGSIRVFSYLAAGFERSVYLWKRPGEQKTRRIHRPNAGFLP